MNISLEKIFFAYILRNRTYFDIVPSSFFKNEEIRFIYDVIRKYMLKNIDVTIPKPKQIAEMVKLEDKDGNITNSILKQLLMENLKDYNIENFVVPKINAWIISNRLEDGSNKIIDEVRSLKNISEYEEIVEVANRIKSITDESTKQNFTHDEELGLSFDNAEHHLQDHSTIKVKTGWSTLDTMLGGGWDINTLNILMGQTNGGKSLWLQNIAVNSANLGYNVLYFTLEMSESKVMKRVGAMRLGIPINEYDNISKDVDFIQKKIDNVSKSKNFGSLPSDLMSQKKGSLQVKFFAASTASVNDLDNFVNNYQLKTGIKLDLIIVDYVTLLTPPKGLKIDNSLYQKGKYLSEGLRAIGAKWSTPIVTAIQVSKDAWNAADITLDKVPESKAIAETADTFFAIIRTEEMKRNNKFRLKLLKQRDGDFSRSQAMYDMNPEDLSLFNDKFADTI